MRLENKIIERISAKESNLTAAEIGILNDLNLSLTKKTFDMKVRSESKAKRLKTAGKNLVATNQWGERFWGVSDGHGTNELGKALTALRTEIASGAEAETSSELWQGSRQATQQVEHAACCGAEEPWTVPIMMSRDDLDGVELRGGSARCTAPCAGSRTAAPCSTSPRATER